MVTVAAIVAASAASAAAPQGSADDDISARLAAARNALASPSAAGTFNGVALIGSGEDVVLHEAYGLAEVEHAVPMRPDHLFRIGSLTKPVTAAAVLAASDRGHLSLNDAACERLSGCPSSWRGVTVRHLLSHTSGIENHFGDLEAVPVEATVAELERVLAALPADEPLESAPGAEYAYSNFNYVLLGAVLERVTGTPWEAALEELVLRPLDLRATAYDDVWAVVPNRARGYARDDDGSLRHVEYDDHAAYAAGGLLSTAEDLLRFSRGMLGGELFDTELVAASLTPVAGNYGLGWQIRRFFDRRIYNHTGGIDGFSSHLAHYPDDELTIVVLSNVESDSAILRACDIAAALFQWRGSADLDGELTPRQRCGLE